MITECSATTGGQCGPPEVIQHAAPVIQTLACTQKVRSVETGSCKVLCVDAYAVQVFFLMIASTECSSAVSVAIRMLANLPHQLPTPAEFGIIRYTVFQYMSSV